MARGQSLRPGCRAGISMVVLVAKIGNNSKTIIAAIRHEMTP
jgi:hypothetical protein